MKTRSIIVAFSLIISVSVSLAQGINESMLISCKATSLCKTDGYKKRQCDYAKHQVEDEVAKIDNKTLGYDYTIVVNNNPNNSGSWKVLPNGDRVWSVRYTFESIDRFDILFNEYFMPEGGKVSLYNEDKTDLLGVYGAQHNKGKRGLLTQLNIKSNVLLIEYYEPAIVKGQGKLNILKILYSDSELIGGGPLFHRF